MHRHIWSRRVIATVSSVGVIFGLSAATAAADPEMPTFDAQPPIETDTDEASGLRAVDWLNTTLTIPPINGCPEEETVTFTDGKAETESQVYRFAFDGVIKYGDVTGDGNDEALALIDCGPHNSHYTGALVVFSEGDERVEPIGVAVNPAIWTQRPIDFLIWHGDIAVAMLDHDLPEQAEAAGQVWTEYYRFSADSEEFERIDND